jgi:hypothetical protein
MPVRLRSQASGGGGMLAEKAVIQMHKFHVGQLVQFNPDRRARWTAPGGLYEVTKQLPHNGREYRYRIKAYARSRSALQEKVS